MSGTVFTKFFWSDWESDPKLKLCSFAAQGFWMRVLCIAATHDPIGYVATSGDPLSVTDLARLTGASETEVDLFLAELARNDVFSRDRTGRIYSRRMVKDARKSAEARKNGKLGGNPKLWNNERNPPPVKGRVKPSLKPHKPSTTSTSTPPGVESRLVASFSNLDFRQVAIEALGEPWVASWLDQCLWRDLPSPCIVAPHEFAAKKVREGIRRLPSSLAYTVTVEMVA